MRKRSNRAKGILLVSFLIFAVVVGALVFRKYDTASRNVEPPATGVPAGTAVVTLFFGSPDGGGLVREGREVVLEEQLEVGIESVVKELVSGPVGSLASTLPPNTRILGVRVNNEVVQIDFGSEFREGIPAGSSAEMAAVYSIVDTVVVNFPSIKGVQFLIEGAPVNELKGHLDLSAPIQADFSLEQQAQAPAEGKQQKQEQKQ